MLVKMINGPAYLREALDRIWAISKTAGTLPTEGPSFPVDLLEKLMTENVPVLRHFYFTFEIHDMPILFREQLVRTQYDHFWIQSGRITKWSQENFTSPKTDHMDLNDWAASIIGEMRCFMQECDDRNVPPEQYRDLVPVGAHHRGIWTVNLESLLMRFRKRACWVAQSEYWLDCLSQVREELSNKYNFEMPCRPPCRDANWVWKGCTIANTMLDRVEGKDPLPVCPMFMDKHTGYGEYDSIPPDHRTQALKLYQENLFRSVAFERMWGNAMLSD